MPYDLALNAFIENGPAAMAIRARSAHSTARVWRALDPDLRMAVVETALRPANDFELDDNYPIAL
jgi:hypothetical protein